MKQHFQPMLPVVLLGLWLLLNDSLAWHQWLIGAALALAIPKLANTLRPLPARPRRLVVAIGLVWHVLLDVIRSNIAVGRIILGTVRQQPQVGFLKIPLDMRTPHGLAVLSIIITATPGTVWAGHDQDSNELTLHVLDLQDEEVWLRTIKERYERPLMEIFG
ncbi:Na+/H+ antiporter subunit E [Zoogloea sp.]|uniref:Na+/H+ antiporter subunit E n=1 Tax=Zoogloea sp. TaxID=49181 RepID=UPI00262BFCFB|nr:Na+/H+ antiporter subunit E [Zoogloea sp.]MDD3352934.1 Na+/H+ antiporter subunit E [Zoogloea sp.]